MALTGLLMVNDLLQAQEGAGLNNSMWVGVSRAFFGSGDITGIALCAEYSFALSKYLSVTPGLTCARAHEESEYSYNQASSFMMSLSMNITPMPNKFKRLKFDLGGLYSQTFTSYSAALSNANILMVSHNINSFELLGSIRINIIDKTKFELGICFTLLTGFHGGSFNCEGRQAGVYFGKKF